MEIKGKVFVVGPNGEEPDRMPIGMIIENPKANFWAPASWQGAQTSIVGKHVQWPETLPLATRLALDVLQGKTESAVILADALAEQHTGNVSELQVEIRRRIDLAVAEAVRAERRACADLLESIAFDPADEGASQIASYLAGQIREWK